MIFWIGQLPEEKVIDQFRRHGININKTIIPSTSLNTKDVREKFAQGHGAVMVHDPKLPKNTISFLHLVTEDSFKYLGVKVILIAESDINNIIRRIGATTDSENFFQKHNVTPSNWNAALQESFINEFPISLIERRANFDLRIEIIESENSETEELNPIADILLRRSFSDCSSIKIKKLSEQGAKAKVYIAYPQYKDKDKTDVSQLPFLVKIGEGKKIFHEIWNFGDWVTRYVPFDLRPNLDDSRSFAEVGTEGILVANYVDNAVRLIDSIDSGSGSNAIHCLLEQAIDVCFRNSHPFTMDSLVMSLYKRFKKDKFEKNPDVLLEANKLGATENPSELLDKLKLVKCSSYLRGKMHGDLHARNILVKDSHSIVIDFSESEDGPILVDLAMLDVSIAFQWMKEVDKKVNRENEKEIETKFKAWTEFVKCIYDYTRVSEMPKAREGYETFPKHWACIRQLRRYARTTQTNEVEFALCLAGELLCESAHVGEGPHGISIAALAYYLSSQLIDKLGGSNLSSVI